ncbi:hypothetical protein [Lachnospira multipara]|uniref:Uncharacterized protein n=1 Tax=Lachnospira multipara TaxID=28051 RepID=A0A1H5VTK7_9FIRM|nr:hypothetical protein [Lachnospira multipara]SEF90298.1 hypothetical protein SAMN05216537_11274 [Lachnospira multipara]
MSEIIIATILFLIECIIDTIIAKPTIAVLLFGIAWRICMVLAIYKQFIDKR